MEVIIKKLFFLSTLATLSPDKIEKEEALGAMTQLINIAHNKENQWHNRKNELQILTDIVNKYYTSKKIKDIFNN